MIRDFMLQHERAAQFVSMGLGKTAATLQAIQELMADGACRQALVVAPLRVARLTWPNEIRKWDNFHGLERNITFINYESLHKTPRSLGAFDLVVFDELTRAKNPRSKRIESLRPRLHPAMRRWGLTGTPRPNSLLELFAQVRLLDDGQRLGRSFSHFQQTWFTSDYMGYNWTPRDGAEAAIYEKIKDLTITLRAEDYSDVPDTLVEDVEVPLPESARGVYDELEQELLAYVEEREVVAVNAAVLVNKLLQVCGGAIYDAERTVLPVHDAKLKALGGVLKALGGERAIVFCNFIHERERICAATPGAVDASKFVGDIEDAWNSGRIRYLVADPRSMGHGLNLQGGGRNIVWFSPTHSRELYDQANARVARKGQLGVPRIYRLLCPGTIDDAVVETLRERGDAQGEMLSILSNYQQLRAA
jgi:SNF2 family DNA or RNA helicase